MGIVTGRIVVTLLVFVAISTVAAVALPVGATQTNVAIQSVNVSVDQPAPGESFTLTVEVANLESSSGPVDVTDVYVRRPGNLPELARIRDVGTIAAGGTLRIPLTLSIDDPGERRLVVSAVVEDADGENRRVNYPLYVDVRQPDETVLSFADLDPVAGQESPINVTVSNGDAGALSNVRLNLTGDARVTNSERVSASLRSGTQITHTYRVTFPAAGERTLNATLTYTTNQGSTRTIHREVTVNVDEADVDADLTATADDGNGTSVIRASLTQYGNVELRDVQLRAVVDDRVVARRLVPDVPAEGTQSVTLDGSDLPAGEVRIVARYDAAGERQSASDVVEVGVDASLTVTRDGRNGSVRASLTQYGNVELRDVQLRAVVDGRVVSRSPVPDVPAGGTRTATLDGSDLPAGNVTFVARYTAGNERRATDASVLFSPQEASNVTLTGVEVTRQGSTLRLEGDTANLGSTDASSVLVSVVDADGVTPVGPNEDYFVGAVEASEFATFELTARTSDGVDAVPVLITYAVDGERFSRTIDVGVGDASASGSVPGGPDGRAGGPGGSGGPAGSSGPPGGGLPLTAIGAVLVVLVAGVLIYRWRRQ